MDNLTISAIAAALLSLGMEYIPGIAPRYAALTETQKKLTMLILLVVTSGALFGLSCADVLGYVECTAQGGYELVGQILVALGVNQGVHKLTKRA